MWQQTTKKKHDQEVFHLNAWEFAMLWEVKLLPATAQAIERVTQRSGRASGKNNKKPFYFGFCFFFISVQYSGPRPSSVLTCRQRIRDY